MFVLFVLPLSGKKRESLVSSFSKGVLFVLRDSELFQSVGNHLGNHLGYHLFLSSISMVPSPVNM